MRGFVPTRTRDEAVDRNLDAIAAAIGELQNLPFALGLFGLDVKTVLASATLDTESVVVFRGGLAATLTLPGSLSLGPGRARFVFIWNDSAVTVTIAAGAGDSLSGSSSLLTVTASLWMSDGASKWRRLF